MFSLRVLLLTFCALLAFGCTDLRYFDDEFVTTRRVPLGETSRPIALVAMSWQQEYFRKVDLTDTHLECDPGYKSVPFTTPASHGNLGLDMTFWREARAANHVMANNPLDLFDDAYYPQADFELGAVINVNAAVHCVRKNFSLLSPSSLFPTFRYRYYSAVNISVDWQVFSTLGRSVVLERRSTGSAIVWNEANGIHGAFNDAFIRATRRFLADPSFVAIVRNTSRLPDPITENRVNRNALRHGGPLEFREPTPSNRTPAIQAPANQAPEPVPPRQIPRPDALPILPPAAS